MIKPITPQELTTTIRGPLYEEAVLWLNEAIIHKIWHEMITQTDDIKQNYNAIIQIPINKYTNIMPLVVEDFKLAGWDCFFSSAYDARGLHHCFYVNKKHFI